MKVDIRTPADVIAIALEDEGIDPERAAHLSAQAAARLIVALRSVSGGDVTHLIYSPKPGVLAWGHIDKAEGREADRA